MLWKPDKRVDSINNNDFEFSLLLWTSVLLYNFAKIFIMRDIFILLISCFHIKTWGWDLFPDALI